MNKDKMIKILRKMVADPVYFCRTTELIDPHSYQEDILNAALKHKKVIINTSRQVGKTTICAALSIWWAITKPLVKKKYGKPYPQTITVVAPTEDLARKLFTPIAEMCKLNPFIFEMVEKATSRTILFKNGSRIQCFTAGESGKQLRGSANDLIIFDEAAHVAEQSEESIFNSALFPSLAATRGSIYLISTPKGRTNLFARIVEDTQMDNDLDWHYIEVDCWQATQSIRSDTGLPQLDIDYLHQQQKQLGNILFAQEYECKLIDIGLSFFDWELIKSCTVDILDNINNPTLVQSNSEIYFGIDVARSRDKTVITVVERFKYPTDPKLISYTNKRMTEKDKKENEHLFKIFVRYIYVIEEPLKFFSGSGEDSQEDVIRELYQMWKPKQIFMDATGLGLGLFEYLQKQRYPVVGITFSQKSKMELLDTLRTLMRTGRISLSQKNFKLHNELNSITIQTTIAGTDVLRSTGKFDDMVMSLALAVQSTRTLGIMIPVGYARTSITAQIPESTREWRKKDFNIGRDTYDFE